MTGADLWVIGGVIMAVVNLTGMTLTAADGDSFGVGVCGAGLLGSVLVILINVGAFA